MRKAGIVVGSFLVVIVAAIVIVPSLVSKDSILQQVSNKVENATGRELSVNGDTTLSIFPSLVVELNDVKFANFEQGTEAHMASMQKLSLHVPWTSVFSGKVIIEQFVIDDLNLVLEKQNNGAANWEFTPAKPAEAEVATSNDSPSTAEDSGPTKLPDSFDVSLGLVQINGGSLTFHDHQTQSSEFIDQLSLEVLLPSLRQPMEIKGQIRYKLQTFSTDIVLDNPIKAIEGETFNTDLTMNSDLVNIIYKGSVEQTPMSVSGQLNLQGDSVKQIALWQEQPMEAKDNAFNQFSIDAAFTFSGNKFDMSELVAKLDELDIRGQTSIYLDTVPKVVSVINLGDLNLNPYLPEPVEAVPPAESEESAPIVWDDTPIDLSGLSGVNLDLTITSSSMQAREIKLGANKFTLIIQDSILNLAMEEFNAYQGKGTSTISLNAARKPYQIQTDFNLAGIDFQPLLTDAAGFDKVLGKGEFNWQLNTSGVSQKSFVAGLNGNVGFDIQDGAVKGANLAAIAESASNIMTGNFSAVNLDQNFNDAEKTDFASLLGSLQFNNGVGTTSDITLLNPLVRITADGTIDLPATNLDMRSSSRLVSSLEGQGGQVDESGINIPIKITGPFHDVKVRPDLSQGIKDKVEDKIKDKLKDKLKGLFGGQ